MTNDISVLIVEDEETWAHQILYDLKQFGFKVIGCINNLDDALPAIRANNFDIVLLDINLNGKNSGIELGRMLSQTIKKPFIFITGSVHDGIMEDAASALPSAFLTKPFTSASLFISIQSAIHHFYSGSKPEPAKGPEAPGDSFFVKMGNKYIRVEWRNVVCLRSERNYTSIITTGSDTCMIRSSLQNTLLHIIPERLKNNFVQINRAEVLQIKFIEEIIGDEAKTSHQSFSITDAYLKNLRQKLNIIL